MKFGKTFDRHAFYPDRGLCLDLCHGLVCPGPDLDPCLDRGLCLAYPYHGPDPCHVGQTAFCSWVKKKSFLLSSDLEKLRSKFTSGRCFLGIKKSEKTEWYNNSK